MTGLLQLLIISGASVTEVLSTCSNFRQCYGDDNDNDNDDNDGDDDDDAGVEGRVGSLSHQLILSLLLLLLLLLLTVNIHNIMLLLSFDFIHKYAAFRFHIKYAAACEYTQHYAAATA